MTSSRARFALAHALVLPTLLVGLFSIPACSSSQAAPPEKAESSEGTNVRPKVAPEAKATRVEVAVIGRSDAMLRLVLPGEVQSSRDADVASSQGGLVESIKVEKGEKIEKGHVIAKVDSALYAAQKKLSKTQLDAARRENKRIEAVKGSVAGANLDRARTEVAVASANYKIAALRSARTVIKAPFDGIVSDVMMEKGEVAGPGSPMVRLVQLDPITISVSVSDRDVVGLEVGSPARVNVSARAEALEGAVTRISPEANLKTRAFEVEIDLPNPDLSLRPGTIATVDLSRQLGEEELVIPQDFVVTRRSGNGVFLEKDGVARWQPLKLGRIVRDQVVVEEGLAEGDRVVVVGHRALVDGDALLVSREGDCCEDGRIVYPGPALGGK